MPISKSVLIHTATYEQRISQDAYGAATYATAVPLSKVRIDVARRQIVTTTGETKALTATLYYDVRLSSPRGVSFDNLDKITFDGVPYIVRTVEKLYDGRGLHHWEVGLE